MRDKSDAQLRRKNPRLEKNREIQKKIKRAQRRENGIRHTYKRERHQDLMASLEREPNEE